MTPIFKIFSRYGKSTYVNLSNIREVKENTSTSIRVYFGDEDYSDFDISLSEFRGQLPDCLFL